MTSIVPGTPGVGRAIVRALSELVACEPGIALTIASALLVVLVATFAAAVVWSFER